MPQHESIVDADASVVNWLLAGDPAIRWQVKRDLLELPYKRERQRISSEGWGARLLDLQCDDGRWTTERGPNGYRGLYTPKWTSTTYTLILLRRFGIDLANSQCLHGCTALIEGSQWLDDGSVAPWNTPRTDTCVCAMFLGLLAYFEIDAGSKRDGLTSFLLREQKSDGGWNCKPSSVSSVHSTISVLEGLTLAGKKSPSAALDAAVIRGQDYLLDRRLMRSKRTNEIIDARFGRFSFPPRWKYDILRALEHFRLTNRHHPDLEEAIALVRRKQRKDGRWNLQNRHSGETHLEMETTGQPSRWNTLRALRVLRWWDTETDT